MTAPVRIEAQAFADPRIELLGSLAGYNRYEALGRLAHLWRFCTERNTYVVSEAVVTATMGDRGASAIIEAELGDRVADGIRIRGTEGRIEWLEKKRRAAVAGGEANKRRLSPGKPSVSHVAIHAATQVAQQVARSASAESHVDSQMASRTGASGEPDEATGHPEGSPLVLVLAPDPDLSEKHTRARERHPAAGSIARRVWEHGAKLRTGLIESNLQVPPWPIVHGADHAGWKALLDRVGERLVDSTAEQAEQVCRNRVDVAAAKARADGEGNWFAPATMFSRSSFDMFAELDPQQFARKARASSRRAGSLIGPANPRTDHPDGTTLIPISEL